MMFKAGDVVLYTGDFPEMNGRIFTVKESHDSEYADGGGYCEVVGELYFGPHWANLSYVNVSLENE